jgi:hypothetical protein
VTIELLYFDGCPGAEAFLPRLERLLRDAGRDDHVALRRVESDEAAQRERFLGSPTLRVDGRDVEPGANERDDYGLKCRLYPAATGTARHPPDSWVLAALANRRQPDRSRGWQDRGTAGRRSSSSAIGRRAACLSGRSGRPHAPAAKRRADAGIAATDDHESGRCILRVVFHRLLPIERADW